MEQKENIEELVEEAVDGTTEQGENQEKSTQDTSELTKEEQLEIENQDLKIQVVELKDKFLRIHAEFDNFRKRSMKERLDFMKTASRDTMSVLLPVLDDFDRAKKNSENGFSEGITIVYNKMISVLEQKGLKAMESTGLDFDADLHEAITEIPVPDEAMKGKIVDTVEKGYYLNDKIIRHAKVVVGK